MMKHRVFLAAVLLTALAFSQSAKAYDFSAVAPSGQTLYYNIVGNNVQVTGQNSRYPYYSTYPTGALTIPDTVTYNGTTYSVTNIGNNAFYQCSGLTSVTIPNSVTSIGNDSFERCSGLTSVTIPNSVTSISNYTFASCSGLTSVTIPNSVTSIGERAFQNCSGLTFVTIPNSVTTIGTCAFYGCSGLTSVTIPASVVTIGNYVFSNCSGLTSITVNAGNTHYDSRNNCNAIIETASNTLIAGCQNTVIPNSVTTIGDGALYGCSGLTSVTIPNSVTTIGGSAFYDCSGLASVTIGGSVTTIGDRAFENCSGLTRLNYTGTIAQWCNIDFASENSNPMYYSHNLYINNAEITNLIVPVGVTEIKPFAFAGCSGLTSVTIPASVTTIGRYAFYGCSGLTSATIPDPVTTIGAYAFCLCSGLTSVTIPNSVTTIGACAFYGCSGLTFITIPNSVTTIGDYAFNNCSGLTSATIGRSVTTIGGYAFYGCSNIVLLYSYANVAPILGSRVFWCVPQSINVVVPCGSLLSYSESWDYFNNITEEFLFFFVAESADSTKGVVQVLNTPTCANPDASLHAIPANGFRFDHWSDGSTSNPYTFTVTSDTTVIAYFVREEDPEGITDINNENVSVYVRDGRIVVTGAEGESVQVFDITGRPVPDHSPLSSGVYMVKVGNLPIRKVVVTR